MNSAWLFKSEPDVYGFEHLVREPRGFGRWDGVRNYQARNMLRDEVRVGHPVLFYHSRVETPAIVGLAEITREAFPDPLQFDPTSPYFDPGAREDQPRWISVELRAVRALAHPVTLETLKAHAVLSGMRVAQRGNRLSITPVSQAELALILELGERGLAG